MKKAIIISLFSALSMSGYAQCDFDSKVEECSKLLGKDYTFLKMYDIKQSTKSGVIEYSNVLSKGNTYKLNTCLADSKNNLVVKIYNHERKLIATNKDEKTGKIYSGIAYECKSTGIYYLQFEPLAEMTNNCSYSVLGFQ